MGINSLMEDAIGLAKENPVITSLGAVGTITGAVVGGAALAGAFNGGTTKRRKSRNSRKRNNRIKHTSRGWKIDRKRRSKQKWEVAYQKRKKKNSKKRRGKIHYARKTGQPYIILASGKAKFIKGKRRKR